MDLYQPVVDEAKWHHNFRMLMTPGLAEGERTVLEDWSTGFQDRDGKFVRELQTTFNSSFWELYLNAVLFELAYLIDFTHASPDFVCTSKTQDVVFEAAIASNAEKGKPEWQRGLGDYESPDRSSVLNLATIRIANAIHSKYKKYLSSYSKLAHVKGKPFVIAVAPFEQPLFFMQNDNALRRVLYGYDQPLWIGEGKDRTIIGEAMMPEIDKPNGASIPLGFFANESMPEVSAVLFSNTATFTKLRALSQSTKPMILFFASRYNAMGPDPFYIQQPRPEYSESLFDGLHLCLNPYAKNPLDTENFRDREIAIHSFDAVESRYDVQTPHGFLFQHGCMSFVEEGTIPLELSRKTGTITAVEDTSSPTWDELRRVGGSVTSFDQNHMCHYEGWTIVIAHCTVDDDWGGQAKQGTFFSLADYIAAKEANFLIPDAFHSSTSDALADTKSRIEEISRTT